MTDISNIPDDPRSDYEKLNRREINRILDQLNIPHPPFCKKTLGIQLMQANNVNPREHVEWEAVTVQGPDGNQRIKHVPKRIQPRRPENYDDLVMAKLDQISAEAVQKEEAGKDSEIEQLKKQLAELQKPADVIGDYQTMKMPQLKKLAKERGLVVPVTTKKPKIIQMLEELDNG